MTKSELILDKIDYKQLREQKSQLLETINERSGNSSDPLDGLVHLLDALQDNAVNFLGKTEEKVFGYSRT